MNAVHPARDPASFRDPSNSVYFLSDRVLRGLDRQAVSDWTLLASSPFFLNAMADGRIVQTETVTPEDIEGLDAAWAGVLEHERIPFRSFPYEWSFSMLRDAAALHLELLLEALSAGFTMADGSAYNVQWCGADPIFIDVMSFRPLADGGPWAGYRQFCQTFLFPLLVQARRGVPAHLLLRTRLEGIDPELTRRLLGRLGWLRRGALRHVWLHAWAAQRLGGTASADMAEDLRAAGFHGELTIALTKKLASLTRSLRPRHARSSWATYAAHTSLTAEDQACKAAFLDRAAASGRRHLAFDLGCNDGRYSRILAQHATKVVAVDADERVVDDLYRDLTSGHDRRILPLVVDLLDPSPPLGWRLRERPGFAEREPPDLVVALELVHHLAIGGNVPLSEVTAWLRAFGSEVVVSFPHEDDPMVERLRASKPRGTHDEYRLEGFARLVKSEFTVLSSEILPSGTRTLFHLSPITIAPTIHHTTRR